MQEARREISPLSVTDDVAKARMFHLAQGILVGLRRRPPAEVLSELIDAAQEFGQSPFAIARALVAASAGESAGYQDAAMAAVRRRWGDLLDSPVIDQQSRPDQSD